MNTFQKYFLLGFLVLIVSCLMPPAPTLYSYTHFNSELNSKDISLYTSNLGFRFIPPGKLWASKGTFLDASVNVSIILKKPSKSRIYFNQIQLVSDNMKFDSISSHLHTNDSLSLGMFDPSDTIPLILSFHNKEMSQIKDYESNYFEKYKNDTIQLIIPINNENNIFSFVYKEQ